MSWTDRDGNPVVAPEPPEDGTAYDALGDFQGLAYERNAFTMGTAAEIEVLWDVLALQPGLRVLDVGCGTGRHTRALADRGVLGLGIDRSAGLLAAARSPGWYVRADARALPVPAAGFDAVVCLCQGGFGNTVAGDERILSELARVLRPGGRLALTAFSLAFAVRWMAPQDAIDVERGLLWSPADVRGPDGNDRRFDLWTTCYSPGHLKDLISAAGLELEEISGIAAGQFGHNAPTLRDPELLVIASQH